MYSCNPQNKMAIDKLVLNENVEDFFQNGNTAVEAREINTTLPFIYTNDVESYKYGTVNFVNSDGDDMILSRIGVLLARPTDATIVGVVVAIENTQTSSLLLKEITKLNGLPEILVPIPQENNDNQLLGHSAYLWRLKDNRSIILTQSYEYTEGKRTMSSLMYMVSNKVKVIDPNQDEFVVDRLIRTYK
ncbi:hypothetical protein [Mariniflexile rhizosphaerae]|uniref:hypothetical protein n=1 Tax=unclassified Mariniflexile TaxID=2643887 RepID=UPI0013C314BF|nr:hypothetical protein [Mariniflexile sp. TRM1-10]